MAREKNRTVSPRGGGTKRLWHDRAALLRVMAHPVRLMILESLSGGSQCIKELNTLVPIAQPHLSQHMGALRKAKLVDAHKDGTLRCYYVLRPSLIEALIPLLREDHPVLVRDRESVQREARKRVKKRKSGKPGRGLAAEMPADRSGCTGASPGAVPRTAQ